MATRTPKRTSRPPNRIEEAFRESEQRYRHLLQGLPAAVYTCDANGRITFFNQAAAALWGREPVLGQDEWCGSWKIFQPDGTPLPLDQCPMAVALREGRILRGVEIVIERPDGSRRHVLPHPVPICDESGVVVGGLNMLVDITDRKQAQIELATAKNDLAFQVQALTRLHDLAMQLARTQDLRPALHAVLDTLIEILSADFGLVSLYDPATELLGIGASVGFDPDALEQIDRLKPGPNVGACGTAFATGQRVVVRDVESDPRFESSLGLAREVGFRAVHSTPILTCTGEILGVLSVQFKECRTPSEIEMRLADMCARHAAGVIDTARGRHTLHDIEERFSRFMQHLPGLAWIKDAAGRYVYANDAAQRAFQADADRLYGKSDGEVFPSDTACAFRENDRLAASSEAGIQTVETLEHDDGEVHYSLVNKFPIPGDAGAATLIGGMAIDITERKRAEESLRESEQRFRTLASHAPVGIFQTGPNGETVFVNESWCEMTGLTVDEARGDGWTSVIHPDDHDRVVCNWNRAVQAGVASEDEFRFLRPDGVVTWLQGNAVPLHSNAGQLVGYIGTVADITQRKSAEIVLRESEERFRNMADHAPVMIWMTEADGRCTYLGKSWYDFTGQSPETGLNFGWIEAVHPDDRDTAREIFLAANAKCEQFRLEYRLLHHSGEYRWVLDVAAPRVAIDGQFLGYIGSVVDITKRKQAEEALQEADRRKDEFLALLAHELRNPLAPICTGLELMRLAGDNPGLIEDVRSTMERQTQQMVRLIDDLLDVSRITRGTMEMRKCRVELATIVESAVETSRPVIVEAGHRLSISLPKQPIVLEADATRLAQVISNLLNNAAKYTRPSGEIRLTAERQGREVLVSVTDTGIGIPAEMLGRVFDMFTQLDGSMERTNGGLGIGLTLVKRIVDMHGGRVEAFSEGTGQGSTFTVRLPVIVGLLDEPPPTDASFPAAPGRCRVLVADDNEEAAKVLGMLIKALGNEVRVAHDGLQALAAAEEFRPDLVLLDIGMPRLNGYDTARRMREQPWGRSTLIAALTGWGQEEDKRRTRDAGFDYHFVKPVEPAALQRLLAQAAR